jgi:hypothetical protein
MNFTVLHYLLITPLYFVILFVSEYLYMHLHAGPHTFSSPSGMFLNSPHGFSCDPETLRNTDAQLGLLNRDNPLTPIMPRGSSSSLRSALGGGGAPLNNEFRYVFGRTFFSSMFCRSRDRSSLAVVCALENNWECVVRASSTVLFVQAKHCCIISVLQCV